ncbi:cysteine--tRNA ligase, cytoplasmic-like isoform X2 [Oratosquilla oratoria]|uniref:cysteine--tRNA ligase, cytoplasmic-like isoform X2 n=1 Tax=Oratosquilla oratoria TaxID=337810 RepID=UPI003F76C909
MSPVLWVLPLLKVKEPLSRLQQVVDKSNGVAIGEEKSLMDASHDVLGEWLDAVEGHAIMDSSIFMALQQYHENDFNNMKALNVLPAGIIMRVSEYVPEIVAFVQKIILNGFAHLSNGSVYFDVAKFDADKAHYYAKLVPEAYGNQEVLQEGEGDCLYRKTTRRRREAPTTLPFGRLPNLENPLGIRLGVPGDPGGTLSVLLWHPAYSEILWTFTQVNIFLKRKRKEKKKDTMEGAHKYHKLGTEFHLHVADLTRRKGDTSNICREAELGFLEAFNKGWSVHKIELKFRY